MRSTHCLEVPLSHKGKVLVSEEYMAFLVGVANNKMDENLKRIERYYTACSVLTIPSDQSESRTQQHNSHHTCVELSRAFILIFSPLFVDESVTV